jgi:hypothetical protein
MDSNARSLLRFAVLFAAGVGTLFWLGSLVQWWIIPANRRDGFELIGVILSTAYFLVLVIPTLVLGLIGRWIAFAAILGGLVVAVASDTLFPWIPWNSPWVPWNWL